MLGGKAKANKVESRKCRKGIMRAVKQKIRPKRRKSRYVFGGYKNNETT